VQLFKIQKEKPTARRPSGAGSKEHAKIISCNFFREKREDDGEKIKKERILYGKASNPFGL